MTQPPTKFLRLGKDGYFNKLPVYQELWESCKGKVAEERIAAGTAQISSSGTLTLRVHRSPPKGAREGSRWRLDGPSRRHGGTFRSAGVT